KTRPASVAAGGSTATSPVLISLRLTIANHHDRPPGVSFLAALYGLRSAVYHAIRRVVSAAQVRAPPSGSVARPIPIAGGLREAQRTQHPQGQDRRGEEGADDGARPHRYRRLDRDGLHYQRSGRRSQAGERPIGLRRHQGLRRDDRDRLSGEGWRSRRGRASISGGIRSGAPLYTPFFCAIIAISHGI